MVVKLVSATVCALVLLGADLAKADSLLGSTGIPLSQAGTPNGDILYPPLSYDGRYIAFFSSASNLVPDDKNDVGDVFMVDTRDKMIARLSRSTAGLEGNGESTYPSLAGEGRFIVYTSNSTNFVPNDDNKSADVFVTNTRTGATELISRGMDGHPATGMSYNYFPAISADGRFVVFNSNAGNIVAGDDNNTFDVFLCDRQKGTITLVSKGINGVAANGSSMHAVISGNGRFVAFHSQASNLVSSDTNQASDVFVYNVITGETELISRAQDGSIGNARSERASISYDGMRISFSSDATNLVDGDTNSTEDVFVFDQGDRSIRRASVLSDGSQMLLLAGSPAMDRKSVMAPDGSSVAFRSGGDNLANIAGSPNVEIYLHNLDTGETSAVSVAGNGAALLGDSEHHALSFDGSIAAFSVVVPRTRDNLATFGLGVHSLQTLSVPSSDGSTPVSSMSFGFIRNIPDGTTSPIIPSLAQ